MAKKRINRPDLTTRNLRAAKKVDASQSVEIKGLWAAIDTLQRQVAQLQDEIKNPLHLKE